MALLKKLIDWTGIEDKKKQAQLFTSYSKLKPMNILFEKDIANIFKRINYFIAYMNDLKN